MIVVTGKYSLANHVWSSIEYGPSEKGERWIFQIYEKPARNYPERYFFTYHDPGGHPKIFKAVNGLELIIEVADALLEGMIVLPEGCDIDEMLEVCEGLLKEQ